MTFTRHFTNNLASLVHIWNLFAVNVLLAFRFQAGRHPLIMRFPSTVGPLVIQMIIFLFYTYKRQIKSNFRISYELQILWNGTRVWRLEQPNSIYRPVNLIRRTILYGICLLNRVNPIVSRYEHSITLQKGFTRSGQFFVFDLVVKVLRFQIVQTVVDVRVV